MLYYYALFTESNGMDSGYTTDRYSLAVFLSQRRHLNDVFTNDFIVGCKDFEDEVMFIKYIVDQYGIILSSDNYIDIVVSHSDDSRMVALTTEETSQLAASEDDIVMYKVDNMSQSIKWIESVLPFTKILESCPDAASLIHALSDKLDMYGKLIAYLMDHGSIKDDVDLTDSDIQCELWDTIVYNYPEVELSELRLNHVLDYFPIETELVYDWIDSVVPWSGEREVDIERWWMDNDTSLRILLRNLPSETRRGQISRNTQYKHATSRQIRTRFSH